MSLAGFDALLSRHPEQGAPIRQLQAAIRSVLSSDESAALSDDHLSQMAGLGVNEVREWLVELMRAHAVESHVARMCPNTGGASVEARHLSELQNEIECPRCGQIHRYDSRRIVVFFVATPGLLASLHAKK